MLADAVLTAAAIEADFTTLVSDEPRREGRVQEALDTAAYPRATFTLTEPVDLGALPTDGETASVSAVGEMTIAGVTNLVELQLYLTPAAS